MTARYAHPARDSVRETTLLVSESITTDVPGEGGKPAPGNGRPMR